MNTLQQIVGAVATAIATSLIAFGSSQQAGVTGLTVGTHAGFMFVLILAIVALLVATQVESINKK